MHCARWLIFTLSLLIFLNLGDCAAGNVRQCQTQVTGDANKCQTCKSSFNQVNWSCCKNTLTNCKSCFANVNKCDSCQSNIYCLSGGTTCPTCASKITNCLTCSTCSICLTCTSNIYVVKSSVCVTCSSQIPNCQTCSSINNCTQCSTNYIFNSASCVTCSSVIPNCQTCSSINNCTQCSTNFIFNSTSCVTCSALVPNCQTCSSSGSCTQCSTNFLLNSTSCISCSSVLSDCIECSSPTFCTKCVNNTLTISSSACVTCSSLINDCLTCSSPLVCLTCVNNTVAFNSTSMLCVPCSNYLSFCLNCNSPTQCINCELSPNIVLSNDTCAYCSSIIPNCLNCTQVSYCTLCRLNYVLKFSSTSASCIHCSIAMPSCAECPSSTVCTSCSSGWIVTNGCSSIPGCNSIIQSSTTCTGCDTAEFQPTPVNGACNCIKGFLAGQYCTETVGCTNTIRNSLGTYCSICNRALRFVLKNKECVCEPYFQINGTQCSDICGDGRLYTLPCDDGNLVDGDGCSSTCQVQANYICNTNSPSRCTFKGKVKLQYICVYKTSANSAKISLGINPYVPNFAKSNIDLRFNSSKNCSKTSYQIVGQNIFLYIAYQQNIQGSRASVSLYYDFNYILSPQSTINITLNECNGDSLNYGSGVSKSSTQTFTLLVQGLSILVILTWLIGSYSHKMIGVQTLHTFQLIFIMQAFSSRYIPTVAYFSGLHHTLNLFQNKFTPQNLVNSTQLSRLSFSADVIYNMLVISLLQVIVLITFIGVTIYIKIQHFPKSHSKQEKQVPLIIRSKPFLYNFLVFPLLIGFFFNFTISLLICSHSSIAKEYDLQSSSLAIVFTAIATFFIFWDECKVYFIKQKITNHQGFEQNYIPIYLGNILILSITIQISLLSLIQIPLKVMAVLTVVYTLFLIIYRPYKDLIHNLAIIINQLGVMINLAWIISQEYIYLQKSNEEMIAFGLIGWMLIIIILAIIRIIYQLRKEKEPLRKKTQKKKKSVKSYSQYENQIAYAITQQALKNINSYRITSQIIREIQLFQQQRGHQRELGLKLTLLKSKIRFDYDAEDQQCFEEMKNYSSRTYRRNQ